MVNNQKGYALLITLILLLLVSVLGIAMLTTNLTAATQNNTREAVVQSEDLAVKGADFFSTSLQNELEKSINNTRLTVPEYINKLKAILQKNAYQCINGNVLIPTDILGSTNVCIEKIYIEGNQNPTATQLAAALKWIVVVKSTSTVDGQSRTVRQHLMYGTDNVPDQLRYALSSNNKGDLFLFGAVEVIGDLKSSNNLYISEYAHYLEGNTKFIQTTPIRLKSNIGNSKVILPTNSTTGIRYSSFNPSSLSDNNTKANFSKGIWTNNMYTTNLLNSTNSIANAKKYFTASENISFERRDTEDDKININDEIDKCLASNPCKNNKSKELSLTGTLSQTTLNTYGTDKQKQFYIYSNNSNAPALSLSGIRGTLNLKGIYFLDGDLNITNTILRADSIFFVDGDVTIRDSEFLKQANEQLYIFATGDIKISNISEYSNTPSIIKGFFYSDKDLSMYGVGSNIYLDGGLSGKNINLSALRGNSYQTRDCWLFCPYYLVPESGQTNLVTGTNDFKKSRLIINYDPQLITDFEKFERPVSNELLPLLNQPVIIKTEIVNASP